MHRTRTITWLVTIALAAPLAYRGIERIHARAKPIDASMAIAGQDLFVHEWTPKDPLANGGDDVSPSLPAG